jgi:predicted nucleic acid-binding protein
MADEVVLLDTSILIDYYRKKEKTKSALFRLSQSYKSYAVSTVTHFEIYVGAKSDQLDFWNEFFNEITVLPFTVETSAIAANTDAELKKKRKQIELQDLFIAATAIHHRLPLASLNKKHFERVDGLRLLH